jgi:hypothetical protein
MMKKATGGDMWCIKPKTKVKNIVRDVEKKKEETVKKWILMRPMRNSDIQARIL